MRPTARSSSGAAALLASPVSILDGRPLSNTVGSVLDPAMSLRLTVHIPAGKTAHLIYATVVASTREEVLALADKHHDVRTFERSRTLAWTQAQVQLQHLGISADEAHLFQRLANAVIYSDAVAAAILGCSQLEPSRAFYACGRREFPVTCPSSSRASTTRRILNSSGNCCALTNTGA